MIMLAGAPAFAADAWQNLADPIFVRAGLRQLPEAAVMTIAQDRTGFLWIGTQGGLARFDGYQLRSFLADANDPKALPDGYTRVIVPDADGGLWIGSSSNGLVHFDAQAETFHTWRPAAAAKRGPRSASVDALAVSDDGRVWIGGDGGLDRFDPQTGSFAPFALVAAGLWTLALVMRFTLPAFQTFP